MRLSDHLGRKKAPIWEEIEYPAGGTRFEAGKSTTSPNLNVIRIVRRPTVRRFPQRKFDHAIVFPTIEEGGKPLKRAFQNRILQHPACRERATSTLSHVAMTADHRRCQWAIFDDDLSALLRAAQPACHRFEFSRDFSPEGFAMIEPRFKVGWTSPSVDIFVPVVRWKQ